MKRLFHRPPKKGFLMIALVQRVGKCTVTVENRIVSSIKHGLLILLGVHKDDDEKDLKLLARKCLGLRIFSDEQGKMNLSVADSKGEIIVVSQFTLFGDIKRGMRPHFGDAAPPEKAQAYYEKFIALLAESDIIIKGGVFGAHMDVELINDGPVTIPIDTRELQHV